MSWTKEGLYGKGTKEAPGLDGRRKTPLGCETQPSGYNNRHHPRGQLRALMYCRDLGIQGQGENRHFLT